MVNVAEQMGIVKNYETQMVKRIFSVNETLVQAILTHRTEVFSMEMHTSLKSALEKLIKSGFSRIPVYDKDPEIIVGIILLKDILRELAAGNENKRLKDIMQKPIFVSSTKKVSHMLRLFKKEKLNMAIVLDEYGGLAGIVTTEDVVEEITGELYDEHEEKESDKIVPMGPATYRIQADTPLNQLTELIGSEARHGRFSQTLAGYITEHSGKLLQEGELLRIDNCEYYIEQTDKNRIVSVIFRKIKKH
jgi:CBS domain containing-hemolysin-like protein